MLLLQIIYNLIIALIFTLLLECFIIVKILDIPIKIFVFTNILTNVVANIIIVIYDLIISIYHITSHRLLLVYIIECLVFTTESFIYLTYYKRTNIIKVLLYTFLSNFISAYVGDIILKGLFIKI